MAEQKSDNSGFDREQALGWLDQDEKMLGKLKIIFMKNMPEQMARLREAVARNDQPQIERFAHSIKGASAMVGALGMKQESAKIETAAGAGDIDQGRTSFTRLVAEYDRVMASLKERT